MANEHELEVIDPADEALDILFSPSEEIAEAAALEAKVMTWTRASLMTIAGLMVIFTPWIFYAGVIFCKMHGVEPPNADTFVSACLTAIAVMIGYGFKKNAKSD